MLASPSASKQPVDTKELREKQALGRSQLMRNNAGYIPAFAVQQRRNFFSAKVNGCAGRHSASVHTGLRSAVYIVWNAFCYAE